MHLLHIINPSFNGMITFVDFCNAIDDLASKEYNRNEAITLRCSEASVVDLNDIEIPRHRTPPSIDATYDGSGALVPPERKWQQNDGLKNTANSHEGTSSFIEMSVEEEVMDLKKKVQILQNKVVMLFDDQEILKLKHEKMRQDNAVLRHMIKSVEEFEGQFEERMQMELQKFKNFMTQGRRQKLSAYYLLHKFVADCSDNLLWIRDMKAVILAGKLAKDVAGAEALLECHQEYKSEIDAREYSFRATAEAGKMLLDEDHFAVDEVKEKLVNLANEKDSLLSLWEKRRNLYEQCKDLQLFYRDTEQVDTWMAEQELFLANADLGDSLNSVEVLYKKYEDFEKSFAAQEEKIKALYEFATKLIDHQHYAADDVAQRHAALLECHSALSAKFHMRRATLEHSYQLQQFERDCNETKQWINEKLKKAMDESYLDPTNDNGKVQNHQSIEQELKANKSRIDNIESKGQELIEASHYDSSRIGEMMTVIRDMWKSLVKVTVQQQLNREIKTIEIWLSEVEDQLLSEDYGKDFNSVQNLIKKHALLEADIASHQDRIDIVICQSTKSATMQSKHAALVDRYTALQKAAIEKRQRLQDALHMQQLYRDVANEEEWIKQKEPIAASTNRGCVLIGIQNLIQKHQDMFIEIFKRENRIKSVFQSGEEMLQQGHFASNEIETRLKNLNGKWQALKGSLSDASEAEFFLDEKESNANSQDSGKDSTEVITKLGEQEEVIQNLKLAVNMLLLKIMPEILEMQKSI